MTDQNFGQQHKLPTVRDLIAVLEQQDQDMPVLVDGYEDGLSRVHLRFSGARYAPQDYCGEFAVVRDWSYGTDSDAGEAARTAPRVLVLSRRRASDEDEVRPSCVTLDGRVERVR